MGNCLTGSAHEDRQGLLSSDDSAFQGEGFRLGTQDENPYTAPSPETLMGFNEESLPKPIHNPELTDEEREQLRADRAAAAEARLKRQGGKPKKKKVKGGDLVGPNSEPAMRWTAGS